MQRPTNDQIGILSVSAVVAWVVFVKLELSDWLMGCAKFSSFVVA